MPQALLFAQSRVILQVLALVYELDPPSVNPDFPAGLLAHLPNGKLALRDAIRGKVHGVALALVPQTQHVRLPRWAHIVGGIAPSLLLMTLQILGRNVAEVRVTHDCAALRRIAREGRKAAQIAEPRRPTHDEEDKSRRSERDRGVFESGAIGEEFVCAILPGRRAGRW